MERLHVLFVCGKNQWRSPTGETIYQNDQRLAVRSAGVSEKARRCVRRADLEWADLVFVMEGDQGAKLVQRFRGELVEMPEIVNLEIPDLYTYMDPELVDLIEGGVETELEGWLG
ncbi:low molecular weight protein tyrosine phosphatase family protein [Rubritalea tangerina]|uniref:Low molecular weight protein tyrosine phosphatase family protein n=1 Tax=Rubritalea tangerina TaxID=430798 RepID=A0ABW4Z717_9BACT